MSIDAILAHFGAQVLPHYPTLQALIVFLAQTNFLKALPFAPYLLLAWYNSREQARRTKILSVLFSCAASLTAVWVITSNWLRPRPLNPESGLTEISQIFLPFFDTKLSNYWGCFPSDHAAYLTALSIGISTINRKIGMLSFFISIMVNGIARNLVGLHYMSDLIVGIFLGFLGHVMVFRVIQLPEKDFMKYTVLLIERVNFLELGFIMVIIEMSVLFADIRFLDALIFPIPK